MSRRSIGRQLDQMGEEDSPQVYGRASSMRKQARRDLPTDLIFCDEYTGDIFQLSYSGASQFLRKMQIEPCRENVDWLLSGLLNTPIDETFPMEDAELSISCRCSYDPQGRSLSEMGIAKSMICKEPSMPPQRYQQMYRQDGVSGRPMNEAQQYMKKCGVPVGDGVGVMFGMDVMELTNALRKGTAGHGEYVGHNDTSSVGGMLGECNVPGSSRLRLNTTGWQG